MAVKNYKELIAWQKAMGLVESIYRVSRSFPKEELYVLTSQLRRAAISIPSNIAEGQGRRSAREFVNFLSIAYGSIREVETQIEIARRLGYIASDEATRMTDQMDEVGRLINGLSQSISRD